VKQHRVLDAPPDLERRRAVKAAGLCIAFLWTGAGGTARAVINARRQPGDAAAAAADGNPPFAPNAFIRVDAHGAVRLVMPNVEMGQGIYTGACMLLAEELDVGLDQIEVEHSPPNDELYAIPMLGFQATGGSTSTRGSWEILREAGAVARNMLVAAAAERWKVAADTCVVERGVVSHAGRHLSYGELAEAAATQKVPASVAFRWWRGVGPTHNLFVVESFMDELAHAGGKDPLEFRRALLRKNPRTRAVLELAAAKIGWGSARPHRRGLGLAIGEAFGSRVCLAVDAEVTTDGEVRVRRAVGAIDCGIAVNPSSVEAQMQGGLLFGLSAALYSGITIRNGAIEQSNFNDYRNLRINETPQIDIYRVDNLEPPGGLGAVGTAIAAPALVNAIFAATGARIRSLPVRAALASGAA
jgi:CO/xanthine dehydrogenase Mo-binding subunit